MRKSILFAFAMAIAAVNVVDAQVVYTKRTGPAGYLGISFNEQFQRDGSKETEQITVQEVSKNSPAEKAGVKAGDEILRVNGMVATNGKFRALARTLVEGDTVKLRVKRDGKERELTIVAAPRPSNMDFMRTEVVIAPDSIRRLMRVYMDSARVHLDSLKLPNIYIGRDGGDSVFTFRIRPGGVWNDSIVFKRDSALARIFRSRPGEGIRVMPPHELLELGDVGPGPIFHSIELGARAIGGAEFAEMDAALAQYFSGQRGVLTLRVTPETPADRAGLQSGDVILKAKGRTVEKISELRSIIAANPEGVTLEISRKGQTRTLELKTRQR